MINTDPMAWRPHKNDFVSPVDILWADRRPHFASYFSSLERTMISKSRRRSPDVQYIYITNINQLSFKAVVTNTKTIVNIYYRHFSVYFVMVVDFHRNGGICM